MQYLWTSVTVLTKILKRFHPKCAVVFNKCLRFDFLQIALFSWTLTKLKCFRMLNSIEIYVSKFHENFPRTVEISGDVQRVAEISEVWRKFVRQNASPKNHSYWPRPLGQKYSSVHPNGDAVCHFSVVPRRPLGKLILRGCVHAVGVDKFHRHVFLDRHRVWNCGKCTVMWPACRQDLLKRESLWY